MHNIFICETYFDKNIAVKFTFIFTGMCHRYKDNRMNFKRKHRETKIELIEHENEKIELIEPGKTKERIDRDE